MSTEHWKRIVEVHMETKAIFLLAEELEAGEFRSFVLPIREHAHALEHILRGTANQLGIDGKEPNDKYQYKSFQAALQHEYRAFFDCADWLAVIIREDISRTLQPYDGAAIRVALPQYYPELRPRILEISSEIAHTRTQRDARAEEDSLEVVRRYKRAIRELREIHIDVIRAVPALEMTTASGRRSALRQRALSISIGIVAGLIAATLLLVLHAFFGGQ